MVIFDRYRCYNGGNQHKFGNICEEQPVEIKLIKD